jgi:hypothetical protein
VLVVGGLVVDGLVVPVGVGVPVGAVGSGGSPKSERVGGR